MKVWLPLALAGLWLTWSLWLTIPATAERIEKDSVIGAIENPRTRFARSFLGLSKEMRDFDKKVQELKTSEAQRVLLLTRPGWNPLVSNATYQLYPRQILTRNVKANPARDLQQACSAANADVVLYRTTAGWQVFQPRVAQQ
ncbi:MAG: hypothetical protein GY747_01645 [Planctomycetes bacterium]|nr:hypothetical protein [Planctomycetota bacterium]MCP4769931.1 hypothetical protein [Planctomycetota bacterium]MCP4859771.1 hypothetical protein [Planctomycetota bacterium]